MPYPQQTFATFAQLLAYINNFWITNGVQEIDGVIGNDVVNGLLTFVEQSPLNWQKAQIISTGGAQTAARPVVVFMTTAPSSISFADNIYYQYCFINTTTTEIPLLSPAQYYDITLTAVTSIPAMSIVNISKANNNSWIVNTVPSSGTGGGKKPLIGIVGGGGTTDPVSGISTFQHNSLIGLGASNNGKITIQVDGFNMTNYGVNQSMTFNSTTGTIDLDYNSSGNTWQAGSGLQVDLNQ